MQFCLVPALLYLFVCCESVGLCGTQMNISRVSEAWDGKYILMPIMRQKSLRRQSLLLYWLLPKIFFLFEENTSEIKAWDTAEMGRWEELGWYGWTDYHSVVEKTVDKEVQISCSSQVIFLFIPGQVKSSKASRIKIRHSSVIMSLIKKNKKKPQTLVLHVGFFLFKGSFEIIL